MNYLSLFKEAAVNYSDRAVLIDQNASRRMTYAQLDELSGRVAAKLIAQGVQIQESVLIRLGRNSEYIAATLGVMKAGAVAVPVLEEYPTERVAFIRRDCQANSTIEEDFFWDIEEYEPVEGVVLEDDALSLLVYTSGSTGNPKGIEHTVASFCAGVTRMKALFSGLDSVVMAATAPMSFIATAMEYYTIFLLGGVTHITSDSVRRDVRLLEDYYTQHRIMIGFISPQMLRLFRCDSPSLKRVIVGSERLSNVYSGSYEILNTYGLSETCGPVTLFPVDRKYGNTPIGKPTDDLEAFILDENGQEVPDGEPGELCFVGLVGRGYRNLPEQTARAFERMSDGRTRLHTGDMVKKDENGNIIYLNRKDWMVKINGQRVETQEIEAVISGMEEISNAVVKGFEDDNGQTYLVAYYVAKSPVTVEKIKAALGEKMPDYMIPRFFKRLEAMPLNANGKLDRKALLPPDINDYKAAYAVPADALERAICHGFETVLDCGKVGALDDYIRLGGDSIKVLKLSTELTEYGVTPEMILRGRTPREIARICASEKRDGIPHLTERKEHYQLTEAQLGVYLECIRKPGTKMYNIPFLYRLPEKLDVEKFVQAVKTVVKAHSAFHVTVTIVGEGPAMVLREREPEILWKQAESLEAEKAAFVQPFDLEQGPLYRMELCEVRGERYFLLDVHHLIFDGSSLSVFTDEVAAVYRGEQPKQERLTLFDVSVYEETMKQTRAYQDAQAFFQEKLSGIEADSSLIADYAPQNPQGTANKLMISAHELFNSAELEQFAKRAEITENTLFLGAFGYTLAKALNQNACTFCTVNNGRHDQRLSDATGMFVKTLPIHLSIHEDMEVTQFLREIQKDFYETMRHDCISFGELAEKYGLIPNITFVYQAELLNGPVLDGEQLDGEALNTGEAQFDLDVMVTKTHGSYELLLDYRNELYSEDAMRSFADTMLTVVREMLRRETLSGIRLVDSTMEAGLDAFNQTQVSYDRTQTVVELFRKQALLAPERPAVVYLDKMYTYAQVDELTDRIAGYLQSKGIGREDVVSVLIPRCEYMVIASLGVLKAGASYQPLDPSYPKERLAFMMEDAGTKLLIADENLLSLVESYQGEVLLTRKIPSLPACETIKENPAPEDLFILLYTSGSTGVPKGCMLEHRNLTAFCNWYRKYYCLKPESRVAAYASYGFDADMMDLYPALTTGACVHIIDESIRLDLVALNGYFEKQGITHSFMTTQVGRQFAAGMENHSLQALTVGGERLVPVEVPDNYPLYNAYGPTECTIFTTVYRIDRLYHRVPIGKALDNLKLYVVDKEGRRLPPCMPGELWIAGHQVGRGYLNRPEQSRKVFISNPFTQEEGYDRVYRTGDIVRFLPDGTVDFIGRNDGQVKIRGFRIELSEVERVIRRFPGIKDATVADFDTVGGGKFLAAYVVSDEAVDVDALNAFILERKPPYMVPAVTMQIDRIPLNQNQKVNKRALPVPEKKAQETIAPKNETQQKIFDCIADVVGSKEFGITTDIYEAGVTSIGAIRLNVLLAKAFDVVIRNQDLKENNTIEKLEHFLIGAKKAVAYELYPDYPLTQTQNGIFVECVANAGTTIYNIPYLFKLSEGVDTQRLQRAVESALDAHPYVKARLIFNSEGEVRATRNDGEKAIVEVVECDRLPKNEELVQPYSLLEGNLYRAGIYKTKHGNYLFLDFHHIICDGTSEAILLRDINRAYAGEKLETEDYTGFEAALDEEKMRQTDAYEKAKKYYDSIFSGVDSNFLPPKNGNGSSEMPGLCRLTSELPIEEIEAYCRNHNLTLNAFFNGVFSVVLSKYSYRNEAVYTTIYNGRNDARLQNSVTMLVKTLPVYCKMEGDMKITNLLGAMKEQLFASMANDLYSFAEISRAYSLSADILFAYQGDSFTFDTIGGEKAEGCDVRLNAAKAPLSIDVLIEDGKLTMAAEYRQDLYSQELVDGMLECMETVAREFLQKTYVREITMLSHRAKVQLEHFNDTDYPVQAVPVHKLFEAQAGLHGDTLAVIANGEKRTYAQLNSKANGLAQWLMEQGLNVGEAVGIILPRTVDVPAAEYGIMKAGGAFLPMLPDYPDDRISYCLKDSGSRFVITTAAIREEKQALFNACGCKALAMEDVPDDAERENPNRDIPADSLGYIIYTSGSTGTPKGVMIEHRNLCNFVNVNPKNHETVNFVSYGKTALSVAAISFDVSLMEIHIPLCNGMTVCMANEEEIYNPLSLLKLIEDNRVDVVTGTPSFISNFVDIPLAAKVLRQIKMYDIGAEVFPETLYEKLRQLSPEAVIVNGYGPTEATISCTSKVMDGRGAVTIGSPAANVRAYICDLWGNILPAGARGELVICGDGVGRGYVNLPEKTAEVFISLDGRKAYRSGDLARYTSTGELEFFGRLDNQVKLRGLRVELDEISNVMGTYPSVTHAIVLVKGEGQQQYLCGYFAAEQEVDKADLTDHMKKSLAPYMIPSVLMQLPAMPLTSNGKINKKALPEPEFSTEERQYDAPVSALQKKLSQMFANALGMEKVGIREDFFALGGTSLTASKIAMKAMLENIPIAYADIFDNPTVEKLERFVLSKNGLDVKEPSVEAEEEAQVELAGVAKVLSHNTNRFVDEVTSEDIGAVLLTGATGFLGIHVLKALITNTDSSVYCLIRKGKSKDASARLKNMLFYYFSDSMEELFGKRLHVIEGDITDADGVETLEVYDFKTVINCAACVKHFVMDDTLERINVHGVENLIHFCARTGRKLVQISTVSIAGENVNNQFPAEKKLHENELFFGQRLENKYIHTKFLAEKAVLEAISEGRLDGKVIRVGNLMSRHSDGEFQINFLTNGFMRTLRGYAIIGKFPVSAMDESVEFSPIDCTAEAIVALSATNSAFTVFHACNSHKVQMGDVIEAMNQCGMKIDVVTDEEFAQGLTEALSDEKKNMLVSGLVSYLSSDSQNSVKFIDYDNSFTVKLLYRLGFKWPITDGKYLRNSFMALKLLGFFDQA